MEPVAEKRDDLGVPDEAEGTIRPDELSDGIRSVSLGFGHKFVGVGFFVRRSLL